MVYICACLPHLAVESRDLSQTEKKNLLLQADQLPKMTLKMFLSPIFLRIQIQLMRLLVGLLVDQLLPSFFILWYDLPINSLTNYPTNNHISWIWMRKKIGHCHFVNLFSL